MHGRDRSPDEVTGIVVHESYRLHRRLGPGLLESVYEALLAKMIGRHGISVERQKPVSFEIDGLVFEEGFRVDLLLDRQVIVELKAVESLAPVHTRQLLTYLRLMNLPVGLLVNFGTARIVDGIHRVVNRYEPRPRT